MIVLTIKSHSKFVNSTILNWIFSVKIFYQNNPSIIARNSWISPYSVKQNITFGKKNVFQFNKHSWEQSKLKNDDIIPNWIVTVFPGTMSNSCSMKKKLFNQNQSGDKDLIFVTGPRSFVIKRCKLEPHNWNSIDVKLECLYLLLSTL